MKSYGLKLLAPAMWIKSLIMPWKSKISEQITYTNKLSRKFQTIKRGSVLYIFLLLVLLTITYRDTDIENSFRFKQVVEHMFVDARYNGNSPLNKVRTNEDMIEYLRTSVIGNLYVKMNNGFVTSSLFSCLISKFRSDKRGSDQVFVMTIH
ncbi:hypothetical protein ScPMuIL_001905 [Solemya velum]